MAAWVRDPSLTISIQADGSFFSRVLTRGIGARLPAPALELLSFCARPREEAEVTARYGPLGAQGFRQLVDAGLLVEAPSADHTPVFFHNFSALDVHRRMLADRVRVDAYAAAIRAAVRPGMAVLDAGTGSGILACLAARAGARVVYAVDQADILEAARGVVERSGLQAQVRLLRGDFRDIRLPEPVDLVITETFGAWALAEAGLDDLVTTCENNLAPGGTVLPGAVELWVAPVSAVAPLEEALCPFSRYEGVHLDALIPTALRRGITTTLLPEQLGGPGQRLCTVLAPSRLPCGGTVTLHADRITGLGCWFQLDLGNGHQLSTHPSAPLTHWRHHFLPLPLDCGGEVLLEIEIEAAKEDRRGLEIHVGWQCGARRGEAWYRLR